jgi:hypothetical protein
MAQHQTGVSRRLNLELFTRSLWTNGIWVSAVAFGRVSYELP